MTPPLILLAFLAEANAWRHETAGMALVSQMYENPHMHIILSMGEQAIPLILEEMQVNGGHWFHALHVLTGATPVPVEDRGRIKKMTEHWLQWGRENGYLDTQP